MYQQKESDELQLLGEYVLKTSLLKFSYGLKNHWLAFWFSKKGGEEPIRKMASYENDSRNTQFLRFSYIVDHVL